LVYFSIGKFQKVKIFLKKQEIKTPNESFPYKMEENGGLFLKTGVQNTKKRENMGIEPLRCAQTPYRAKRHAA
jgi:hypothetical protein